jgi:hypothetical protein
VKLKQNVTLQISIIWSINLSLIKLSSYDYDKAPLTFY